MGKGKLLEKTPYDKGCFIILSILALIYLADNLTFLSFSKSSAYIYAVKPVIWAVLIIIWKIMPKPRIKLKRKLKSNLKWWIGYLGAIYIVCMFIGGIVEGFGKSPYDLSFFGILKNALMIGSMIIAIELSRSYLLKSNMKDSPNITIAIIAVFITIIQIPLSRVFSLKPGIGAIEYLGEYVLTGLSMSILATYLSSIGGPILSIIYMLITQCFFWFCPLLPNTKWITNTLIGTLCPIFSLMLVQYMYMKQTGNIERGRGGGENPAGWIITSIFSIFIIWFAIGVFPVSPAVIATGSMEPLIKPGDVVLVRRITDVKEVNKGDIVKYKRDNIYIFHRIINIVEEDNKTKYQTKGDNNSSPDGELVIAENIKGEVIKVVPKIGWPTLLLKSQKNVPKEKVEF